METLKAAKEDKTDKHNWYDNLQYVVLLLLATAMPIRWRLGLFAAIFLGVVTIVKIIAQHRMGNPSLNRPLRMVLYAPIVYWLILACSLLWSHDVAAGMNELTRMTVLLIFPLCVLLAGILGLLSLLLFLITPLFVALRNHSREWFVISLMTGIVMINMLFESMFERQMGLLFIGALYAVMVLMMSVENKKPEVKQTEFYKKTQQI